MGYYGNEPQASEAAIEDPIDQVQAADAAISEDLESDLGDGLKAVRTRRRDFGW